MANSLGSMLKQLGRTLLNSLLREARTEVEGRVRDATRPKSQPTTARKSGGTAKSGGSTQSDGKAADGSTVRKGMDIDEVPIKKALASIDYSPNPDGVADPGEVVWTWIPYEEDETRGKDRPVLVMGRMGDDILVAQMTSKDHTKDAAQEAHWGRYWIGIGSGAWDPKGRPSDVRLDRVLAVPEDEVRRQGSAMPKATFQKVVDAMEALAKSGKV